MMSLKGKISILSFVFVVMLSIAALSGCASTQSALQGSLATEGFQPKVIYNLDYDKMFSKITDVLDGEHIDVNQSDRIEGRIVTDYIEGETQVSLVNFALRHKYTIKVTKISAGKTKVSIIAKVERRWEEKESFKGQYKWEDISKDKSYADTIRKLEYGLYEKIERAL